MLATVPGGPKTSYVMCLGLKGLLSVILVSAYNGLFSEPNALCSRDTVHPPTPITTKMTNGIHSRLTTPKIANPLHPVPRGSLGGKSPAGQLERRRSSTGGYRRCRRQTD